MEKLYRKYAFKLYPMILVVNQYILLESSFEMMLSELKMSGKWQIFYLLLIYLKHSTEQKSHFIKLWYLKWKGVDTDKTLHLLSLNRTAEPILSSDWSDSLKLWSDSLGELETDEFQKWHKQTQKQTHRQTYFISPCWTALLQLKNPHKLSDALANNYSASHKHDKTMLYLQYLDNISPT